MGGTRNGRPAARARMMKRDYVVVVGAALPNP